MLQISSFVLYHASIEQPRLLRLNAGLNVLTGWRNTGKSSLLEIVDYCFGRSTLNVSEGRVRETVAWYGLILRNGDRHVFVARPAPSEGRAGSTEAMFVPLEAPIAPRRDELRNNCLVDQLRAEISAFAGFEDTRSSPPEGARRNPLDLHIGHALPITMQDEEDVISKSRLFHRGEEREVMQALRDTFPYMVGASDAGAPVLRARLAALRTERRRIERDLEKFAAARDQVDDRALSLFSLAAQVGLVGRPKEAGPLPPPTEVRAALRAAVEVDPEGPTAYVPTGEAERLLDRRRELSSLLRAADRDVALLRSFGTDRDAFAVEVNEQRARLATVGLLQATGGAADRCPVCESSLETPDDGVQQLIDHLHHLQDDLVSAQQMEPRTRAAIEHATAEATRLTEELRAVNGALSDLSRAQRAAGGQASLAARRARVQGLIEEYLRTLPEETGSVRVRLTERLAVLAAQIKELEPAVDGDMEQERLEGALAVIGADMTEFARTLKLEHAEGQVGLRLSQTTLTITTREGRTFPLRGVGGGGTRVGYHLVAHLAIHKLLRIRDRPTPAFLLLDQPTGPFYPDDIPDGVEPQLADESDEVVVAGLFELVRSVVDDLGGALQVLITDHAKFYGEPWFDQALVEDWRHGRGLIPDDWD